jgi:hypothetical protein
MLAEKGTREGRGGYLVDELRALTWALTELDESRGESMRIHEQYPEAEFISAESEAEKTKAAPRRERYLVTPPLPIGPANGEQVKAFVKQVAAHAAELGRNRWGVVDAELEWLPGAGVPNVVLTIEREAR